MPVSLGARSSFLLGALTLAIIGCGEDTSFPTGETHLETVQAPSAIGAPGARLTDTIRVRLVDQEGTPQPGRPIAWVVRQGGGTIEPVAPTTDANGVASARWSLGSAGLNEIEARTEFDSALVFQSHAEGFRVDVLDSDHTKGCGLRAGDLWCWGIGSWVGTAPVSEGPLNPFNQSAQGPGVVSAGQGYTRLALGDRSVCALDVAGAVHCFGSPDITAISPTGVPVLQRITGGSSFTFCGLATADSTAWCWDVLSGTASQVDSALAFISLEMDYYTGLPTVCGILVDSTAACWGEGPLGDGTFNSSATPVAVSGGRKFRELAVGWDFSCGLDTGFEVWCWGRNDEKQLNQAGADSPVPVLAASGVSRIEAGRRTMMAFHLGNVVRWGLFGTGFGSLLSPLASVSGLPVVDMATTDNSCVRLHDGQVYCYNEMFVNSSGVDTDDYSAVKPVV